MGILKRFKEHFIEAKKLQTEKRYTKQGISLWEQIQQRIISKEEAERDIAQLALTDVVLIYDFTCTMAEKIKTANTPTNIEVVAKANEMLKSMIGSQDMYVMKDFLWLINCQLGLIDLFNPAYGESKTLTSCLFHYLDGFNWNMEEALKGDPAEGSKYPDKEFIAYICGEAEKMAPDFREIIQWERENGDFPVGAYPRVRPVTKRLYDMFNLTSDMDTLKAEHPEYFIC